MLFLFLFLFFFFVQEHNYSNRDGSQITGLSNMEFVSRCTFIFCNFISSQLESFPSLRFSAKCWVKFQQDTF